jgi:Domain of unknown function (DUF4388)
LIAKLNLNLQADQARNPNQKIDSQAVFQPLLKRAEKDQDYMALSGNFETFNLNSIFQLLSADQKTGVLKVKNEDKEIRIYLKDGEIIYATGSQKNDRLGHFLKSSGVISEEQLKAALEKSKAEKQALGKVFIEQGLLSSRKLQEIIHRQIEHLIFNLFLWDKGEFEYNDAAINVKNMVVAKINVVSLLLEASRRIDEISILRKHIPDDALAYRITGQVGNKNEITLSSAELKILGLVDGQRSIRRVIRDSGFDEYSAYKNIYSLLSSGLIEPCQTAPAEPTPQPAEEAKEYSEIIGPYDNVLRLLFRSLEAELGQQAAAVFHESKNVAVSPPYEILRNFQPQNAVDINIREISRELAPIANYPEACRTLINSFNEFIFNILSKAGQLLGPKMTLQAIREINAVLHAVELGQSCITDRERVSGEIKQVLLKIQEQLEYRQT